MMEKQQASATPLKFPYFFLFFNLLLLVAIYFAIVHTLERALSLAITESTQAGNAAITRIFVNEVYPEIKGDLQLLPAHQLQQRKLEPEALQRVDTRVRQFMWGTDILKAKIYNAQGDTLYSSDFQQVGENKMGSQGFDRAIKGQAASQVTHRGQFSALDGDVYERDLVASYIPIHSDENEIIGVAEIYTDRSAVITYSQQLVVNAKSEIIPMLMLVLFFISLIIWRFTSYVTRLRIEQAYNDAGSST
ncbi:MAG: hypothetical protein HQL48_02325 [Gammaproteobacteria bacterium]|nr:hypothetical protein [Gammaproteobacteria bacterium]